MLVTVGKYLKNRLADPVSWVALSCIGAWAISALFAVPPYQMLNILGFAFASAEWYALGIWWSKRRSSPEGALELPPALDRWKVIVIASIALLTLFLDLWVGASTLSALGLGLTALGISSIITLWYAWSRPVIATSTGLLVGIDHVSWHDVKRIIWDPPGRASIEFAAPNYFYGAKITVPISAKQALDLDAAAPGMVERVGSVPQIRGPKISGGA